MNWFKNISIRSKMLLSFMLVIVLVMMLVVLAVNRIMHVGRDYVTVVEHPIALRATLQEFIIEFRNIRRINAVLALHSGMDDSRYESLVREEAESHDQAIALLDRAKDIVSGNPELTQAERNDRIANNDILRGLFNRVYETVSKPIMEAVRTNDREALWKVLGSAEEVAQAVREKHNEMLLSARDTATAQVARAERDAGETIALLITVSVLTALVAIAVSLYMADYLCKPLAPLTRFMTNMATAGDIAFSPGDARTVGAFGRHGDEMGQLISAATVFVGRIQEIGRTLEAISRGDLTSEVSLLSGRDSIGIALRKMLDNLNAICGDITRSSMQVATCANQVTAGAQSLSAGSTEQAASVEELSVSIASMDDMTKDTARMAEQAAALANSIRESAEKSSIQMSEMMLAIDGINEASQSIRKIIKTIDEIAFQTNILAVNAAVEAAHAGKYGKGFSVVATEVRNLAAKSTEAAKDTERLIANSIEKAAQGVLLANEASASIAGIVEGINDNSLLVTEIARSSEEQSASISQINAGVVQVSQVVYRNSSTAEESAAASEEMARQSVMLQDLAGRFRLNDSVGAEGDAHTLRALPLENF